MFVDEVEIDVESGSGGGGAVSFRREKYVPRGGPDGGDGGRGGDVIVVADVNLGTLLDFRSARRFKAGNGGPGRGKKMHGSDGADVLIRVPAGTIVAEGRTRRVIADLIADGERATVAYGGRGGRGNFRFRSATNRTPRRADPGGESTALRLRLTLKLIADVGLVGLPNAGKSTLLSRVSRARPKIAEYPFTTLAPNLGIVRVRSWESFVMADIPGLIEGAHAGKGLGHRFLRHVERTRILVFMIDSSAEDPAADYETLIGELGRFSDALLRKPRIVVYTKKDLLGEGATPPPPQPGLEVLSVSSVTGDGLPQLVDRLGRDVRAAARSEGDGTIGALGEESQ